MHSITTRTDRFTWDAKSKTLVGEASTLGFRPGLGFPARLAVTSEHTGRTVEFVYDERTAERHEWWDGERAEYIPVAHCNCERLIIIND